MRRSPSIIGPRPTRRSADAKLAAGDPRGRRGGVPRRCRRVAAIGRRARRARALPAGSARTGGRRARVPAGGGRRPGQRDRRTAPPRRSTSRPDATAAAEPFLKTAAAQPNQKLKSTLALADYYSAARRYQEARAVLEPMTTGPIGERRPGPRLARRSSSSPARRPTRGALIDGALKKRPTAEALAVNAQLLVREGKPDDALARRAPRSISIPHMAAAHYVVGTIELERGHLAAAERAFREVLRQNRLTAGSEPAARANDARGRPAARSDRARRRGRLVARRAPDARARADRRRPDRARPRRAASARRRSIAASPRAGDRARIAGAGRRRRRRRRARRRPARCSSRPTRHDALLLAARATIAANDTAAAERLSDPRDRRRAGERSTATRCWRRSTRRAAISTAPASTLEQFAAAASECGGAAHRARHRPRGGRPPGRRARPLRAGAGAGSRRTDRVATTSPASTRRTKRRCRRRWSWRATRRRGCRAMPTCTTRWAGSRSGPDGCRWRRRSSSARSR